MIAVPSNDEEKTYLLKWLAPKIGSFLKDAQPVGLVIDKKLVAVAALHNRRGTNVEFSIATEKGWNRRPKLTKSFLWLVAMEWAKTQMKCERITAIISKNNRKARHMAERAGMKLEGVLRKAEGGKDLMLYGLLFDEYKL